MGRDVLGYRKFHVSNHFNPRALVGRDSPYLYCTLKGRDFNPRALVGRDAWRRRSGKEYSYFNPRALVGRDPSSPKIPQPASHFNPRALVGRDSRLVRFPGAAKDFNPRALVGRDSACLHGLNYSGHAIFFANLIFSRAVTGIFRRKVLCVIRVRTEILRLFSRRRCLLQHQSSFSFITWFCTDVLRFSCVFIA